MSAATSTQSNERDQQQRWHQNFRNGLKFCCFEYAHDLLSISSPTGHWWIEVLSITHSIEVNWKCPGCPHKQKPDFTGILRPFHRFFRGFRTQSAHSGFRSRAQDAADAQQRPQRDRFAGLNPLPVADRIAEGNHVFLAVAAALAQRLDALAQAGKEFALEFGVFGQQCSLYGLSLLIGHGTFKPWYNQC